VVDTISFKTLGRRKLSDEEYEGASKKVLAFLAGHDFITNREFRALTHLSYDQAVSFFNRMIAQGDLIRVGKTTGIKYQLPAMGSSSTRYC
jgi:hypothetical protein